MNKKIVTLVLMLAVSIGFYSLSAFANVSAGNSRLHSFYLNGVFNGTVQHPHVLKSIEYSNQERIDEIQSQPSIKFTGELYIQEKSGKNFADISPKISSAIDAGAAYLAFWIYIDPVNIPENDPNFSNFDMYFPTNIRTRGEWIYVTQQITNKAQNNIYFKSNGVYTWLNDISIVLVEPDNPEMAVENIAFEDKNGNGADSENVYFNSKITVNFTHFIDSDSENLSVKVIKESDETEVATTVSLDKNSLSVVPVSGYEKDTSYKLVIKNIYNIFGYCIDEKIISFKTAKPENRTENIEITSNGSGIEYGDSISDVTMSCDIVNDGDSDKSFVLIFAVEKNGETVKAKASSERYVGAGSRLENVTIAIDEIQTYVHSDEYEYTVYLLNDYMLPIDYDSSEMPDNMTADATLFGDEINFRCEFQSKTKKAVTVIMVKTNEETPDFNSIGYFKTGFTDDSGVFSIDATVSSSVESGAYSLIIYGEGIEKPFLKAVEYIGEDSRKFIADIIKNGTCQDIEQLLSDVEMTNLFKSIGILIDDYNSLTGYKSYICESTADDTPDSDDYKDCVTLLNRYIILAKLKHSSEEMYPQILLANYELLDLDNRIKDVLENVLSEGNYSSFSNVSSYKTFDTFTEFTDEVKTVFAIAALNLVEGNDYPTVSSVFEVFRDIFGIDAQQSFESNKITSYNRTKIFKEMIGHNYTDVSSVKKRFDELLKEYKPSSSPNGSGGSGGSGSAGGGKSFTVAGNVDEIADKLEEENEQAANEQNNKSFTDISGYSWALEAIESLTKENIINGYPDNTFRPGNPITRAEFVKVITTAFFPGVQDGECNFTDVAKSHWCYKYICEAVDIGLINGISETYFGADENITRQQAAVICKRTIDVLGLKISSDAADRFADTDKIADYAAQAVESLHGSGIVSGDENGYFNPTVNMSRAEASKIIFEIHNLAGGQSNE